MKSKLLKILTLLILFGCIAPTVSATKPDVIARGMGKITWTNAKGVTRNVQLRAQLVGDVEYNSEGGVNFPIKCTLQMIVGSTKQGEVLSIPAFCLPEIDDEVIVGLTVKTPNNALPIEQVTGKNGKTSWVTRNAVMDIKGQEIEVNMIWKLNIVLEDYQINNVPDQ